MLNAIATGVVSWLLLKIAGRAGRQQQHRDQDDPRLLAARRVPGTRSRTRPNKVYGSSSSPILVGVLYWFVLNKTRFGFDLRATGRSETAAVASGVNVHADGRHRRCSPRVRSPAWSACRCSSGRTTTTATTFQAGLGFAGIAIALLGRNNAVGIAFAVAAVRLPRRPVQRACRSSAGVATGARHHHPGRHPVRRRHRLRAVRRADMRLEQQRVASELAAQRDRRPPRKERRHERLRQDSRSAPPTVAAAQATSPAGDRASGSAAIVVGRPRRPLDRSASSPAPTTSTPRAPSIAAIGLAVPIGLAGLGGLWSERAGVVNIGLEGMMILGTWGAGFFGYHYGPWAGILGRDRSRACSVALIHALATVIFGVDHIVSGVAINIIGLGVAQVPRGRASSPACPAVARRSRRRSTQLPILHRPRGLRRAGNLEQQALVPRVRPRRRAACAVAPTCPSLTIIAVLLFVATWWVLWRTAFGLRLRSVRRVAGRGRVARRQRAAATSSSPSSSRVGWPGSAVASSPSSPRTSTATARPVAAATSASRR